jgi:2-polyprenyl-6-methoxyphenol hydroxylase-like FAD-dependent oxidoreductase
MTALDVLVVGAGAAGAATAILLADGGMSVDLIEAEPAVTAIGSGITVQGNALRVLRQLGVWEQVRQHGYAFNTVGLRTPDGTLLAEFDDVRTGGADLPATLGMYRPDLARILAERATRAGARLRFGTSLRGLGQDADGVDVTFSDGATGRYDLVIGADGVRSTTRGLVGIDVGPRSTGMGIWRALTTRPASVTRTDLIYGGPCYIAGYCPTGQDALYAYLVEDAQDRSGLSAAHALAVMRQHAAAYHGPWDEIRAGLTDPSAVHYTWFEAHVLDAPWHRGRVVLIGDAAHSCPPTLAQGAAQALEDAAVLAELLLAAGAATGDGTAIDGSAFDSTALDKVLTAFAERRHPRAKAVVDASVQLGQWLLDRVPGDVPGLIGRISHLVSDPA